MKLAMSDKLSFDPEKVILTEFKMLKGKVDTPEFFNSKSIKNFTVDNSLTLSFNIEKGLVKAEYSIDIESDSENLNQSESKGSFHFVFIYLIDNLDVLAVVDKNQRISLDPFLANALASITYSTSRGILMMKLQGTALKNFILPIINPSKLIAKS